MLICFFCEQLGLGHLRRRLTVVKRRKYYATKGPDFIWVMDQVRVLSIPVYKRERLDLMSLVCGPSERKDWHVWFQNPVRYGRVLSPFRLLEGEQAQTRTWLMRS